MFRYRFISDESEAYISSRNTLSSLVVNKGRPGVLGVLDTRPYTLQYTFSAAMCRPNSVKWEDVSVILFQKLGVFFLFVYANTWDARPDIELPITPKTVVMEQFTSGEKRSKFAIIVLKCNAAAVKAPDRSDDEYSLNLGDAITHLNWIQAFIQTPASVTAASVTKIAQKAFPVSIQVTHVDFIAQGGHDSGFAYTLFVTMSDGYAGTIIRLERDITDLHVLLTKKCATP